MINLIKRIFEIIKKLLGEDKLDNLMFKINSDVKNDPNSSDHTLLIFEQFSTFFQT